MTLGLLNQVDPILIGCCQIRVGSVSVRVFRGHDAGSDLHRSVGVGWVDQLDSEIGRVRADCLDFGSATFTDDDKRVREVFSEETGRREAIRVRM